MAIWDLINSTTEAVKNHAPIPAPVKQACGSSYNFCYSAGGKVFNAVKSSSGVVNTYLPDEQTRSLIGIFAYKFTENAAKYAIRESYKLVPGGKALGKIVEETVRDCKLESQRNCVTKKVTETGRSESPEDVLKEFMATEFIGNRLLLPQMMHGYKNTERN